MSEEIKLKPCPYCNGKAEIDELSFIQPYAICSNDNCPVQPETDCHDTTAEVVERWNARPLEEELERTLAVLVDAVKFALASADFAASMSAREAEARLRSLIGETP